jgi:uncharacterized protein YaaQ
MKLIVAIVNSDDSESVTAALREKGFRSTKISTTGGFLRGGNATILVGTEDAKVDHALAAIHQACHPRKEAGVEISGATVFVLDVVRHERI